MSISLSLHDSTHYALKVLRGPDVIDDYEKARTLAVKQAVFAQGKSGAQFVDHYLVPRADLSEILHRWKRHRIFAEDEVEDDFDFLDELLEPFEDMPRIKVPSNYKMLFKPKPGQEKFITINEKKRRLILAARTGAGKTFQSLQRLHLLHGAKAKAIIFTIDGAVDQWEDPIRAIFGEETKIVHYAGTKPQRKKAFPQVADAQLIICNYQTGHELASVLGFRHGFILDEAHLIRNHETLGWRRLQKIVKLSWQDPSQLFLMLTGTPMGQYPTNLWSLLRMVHPLLAASYWSFHNRYMAQEEKKKARCQFTKSDGTKGYYYGKKVTRWRPQNTTQLRRILSACFVDYEDEIRYEDIRNVITVPLTEDQRGIYDEIREGLKPEMEGEKISVRTGEELMRLLQAAEGLYNFKNTKFGRQNSGKLRRVTRMLKDNLIAKDKHKVAVWGSGKTGIRILGKRFREYGVIYSGAQNKEEKLLAKWSFNGCKNPKQLEKFYQLKEKYGWKFEPGEALYWFGVIHQKTSLALDLQECWHQIILAPSYDSDAMRQMMGRILRENQTAPKCIHDFIVAADTWESEMLKYVLSKMLTTRQVLKGKGSRNTSETRALLSLLYQFG